MLAFIIIDTNIFKSFCISFLTLIDIIIILAIFFSIQTQIDSYFKKKIELARTAETAIKYRKKLKSIRLLFFIVLFTLVIGGRTLYFVSSSFSEESSRDSSSYGFMAVYSILISLCRSLFDKKKFYKMYGNISSFTKDDYLKKNPRFALFLRGFQDDEYTPLADIEEGSEFASFSEYHFIKLLESRIPVCALGWEKELDSPYGASRIYVDNNTWKSDVLELMIKAEEIYILVNDRENCIWEIGQTKRMLDKTTFIIDQKQKYENARHALADIINLPELPENSKFYHHQILRYQDNRYYFLNYDNSIEQYSQMLGIPKSKRKMKTIYHKGCFLIVLIIFLSILLGVAKYYSIQGFLWNSLF